MGRQPIAMVQRQVRRGALLTAEGLCAHALVRRATRSRSRPLRSFELHIAPVRSTNGSGARDFTHLTHCAAELICRRWSVSKRSNLSMRVWLSIEPGPIRPEPDDRPSWMSVRPGQALCLPEMPSVQVRAGTGLSEWPRAFRRGHVCRSGLWGWRGPGMISVRAATPGLPRCLERLRPAPTAAAQRPGQRRGDPCPAPPDRRPTTPTRRATATLPTR